jgi:hypothetical protein
MALMYGIDWNGWVIRYLMPDDRRWHYLLRGKKVAFFETRAQAREWIAEFRDADMRKTQCVRAKVDLVH